MDLELSRIDYTLIGITKSNNVKILPSNGYKKQQKVAVSDQDGVLQVFSIKKEEVAIQFKTLPGPQISCLQLGGAPNTVPDKIFIASENRVRGYNKKGKLFLTFDTTLTENIKSMFVIGADLIVCGNHVYNHYKDCKDTGSYLCGDTIVDCAALCPNNTSRIVTALACSGRVLRLLEHCRLRQSIELDSVPTVLHVPRGGNGEKIICGFTDGHVILVRVPAFGNDIKLETLVNDKNNTSAITCLDTYDLSDDGRNELIIGRRDGTVQVFTMNSDDPQEISIDLHQIFHQNYNENISSVRGGCVGTAGYNEIIVCTYTGRVFGLTTQCIDSYSVENKNISKTEYVNDPNSRIAKLKLENLELEKSISKEREKYQLSTQALSSGLSAIPILAVNDTIHLNKSDASYVLSIEIPASIENILLQSDVPIDLLDIDKNSAVVSFSECEPLSENYILATYRCQMNTNRIDLKFRTIEGQHGTLQIYITPVLQPKCCQQRKYSISPLSLHMISHNFDDNRPYNTLILKGNFSMAEMHNWLSYCLNEIPEKLESIEKCSYNFINVFIGTILKCEYNKGFAEFKSDNISTISILKDVITKHATIKRIKLEITLNINDNCIPHILKILEPKLKDKIKLSKDYKLLQNLKDLDLRNEDEKNALAHEYKYILSNEQKIVSDFQKEPALLDRLYGLMTDLYVDRNKLKGVNVKTKIAELIQLIDNYDFDQLVLFYGGKVKSNI